MRLDNEERHDGALDEEDPCADGNHCCCECTTCCDCGREKLPRLPCVLVPQHPTRMGAAGPERMPLDLRDAERYGRVIELLEPTAKPFDPDSVEQLDSAVADTSADDWLLCIGNPTLIAVAAGAMALAHGRLNILQWQSRKGHYEAIRITYLDMSEGGGTLLEVVTIPPGEDDDRRPD